ncbi:Flp family type IVb pilin [Parvibaculum sp.]|uniref:Flp family type IVb pilin n=1 Tax=Parvibaculum sp. TaxID=2024848 RepID=UPI003C7497EB
MSVTVMKAFMRRFAKDESGISAVEYGLLAAGIAVGLWVLVGGDEGIGGSLRSVFTSVKTDLSSASGG